MSILDVLSLLLKTLIGTFDKDEENASLINERYLETVFKQVKYCNE